MVFDKLKHTTSRAAQVAQIAAAARNVSKATEGGRERAQRALAVLMADARGVPLKVGQFMGSLGKGEVFNDLARGIAPQPIAVIRPAVEAALQAPIESVFSSFDEIGIAASLGQVHKACLHSGEAVAVKVRYPDIVEAIDAEMRLANLIPGLGPVRKWGFDLNGYKQTLLDNMHQELDYRGEMVRQQQFAEHVQLSGLVVPMVFPELSSEGLLVQSWETGVALDEVANWSEAERKHIAVILMCTLFQSLFNYGTIHGDPHLGNYRFRRGDGGKPEVILLDYGCMVPVAPIARSALLKLVLGAIYEDETDPLLCFQAIGFDASKLHPIQAVLPALTSVLTEPFTTPTVFSMKRWQLQERVDVLLGESKWWFRSSGPPNLLLLLRAFHGLMMQMETLQVALPWQQILFRIVGRNTREEASAMELPPLPEDLAAHSMNFRSMARYLKVNVSTNGRQIAAVTMPASQVTVLEELIPEETLVKLATSSLDLDAIKRRACESGIVPQALFEHNDGEKSYRVWLE